jgi:hypothetical protein
VRVAVRAVPDSAEPDLDATLDAVLGPVAQLPATTV